MTGSYVLVTAGAVAIVELAGLGVIIPSYLSGQNLESRVLFTAGSEAERVGVASLAVTQISLPAGFTLGTAAAVGPGQVADDGQGVVVPQVGRPFDAQASPLTVALLLTTDGTVLASSYQARYPVGGSISTLGPVGGERFTDGLKGAISDTPNGKVAWAVQPVLIQLSKDRGVVAPGESKSTTPDGFVYVQAPVQPWTLGSFDYSAPLLAAGLIVLALAVPVGALFGLLTTRGLVRRLRRLTATTTRVAAGGFDDRVTPGSADEVGSLERNFNEMAERLSEAVAHERKLADTAARQAERNRISRELHDSISQELFSVSLLAAGLEKALPQDSPLRGQVRALHETSEAASREMRALLLELRPASLEEKGLLPALGELVGAYATRLGVKVDTDLQPVHLSPAAELVALRVAQEGLANATRHARATAIRLELHRVDGHAALTLEDDGVGFDTEAARAAEGFGLRMMRERVEEIGGSLTIKSEVGKGSVLSASIPGVLD